MNDNMVVFRLRKIKSQGDYHGLERHNTIRTGLKHREHPENERLNKTYLTKEYGDCDDLYTIFKKSIKGLDKKPRKDAVLGFECICSLSSFEGIDIKDWANEVLKFFARTWGKHNVYAAFLHRDEKTPHLHIVLGCVLEDKRGKRLSGKSFSGGPEKMRQLQTDFAAALERFGVVRGIPKAQRRERGEVYYHKSVKSYWGEVEQAEREAAKVKAK